MMRVFIAGPADCEKEAVRLLQTLGMVHVEPASEMAGEYESINSTVVARARKLDRIMEDLRRFKDTEAAPSPDIDDAAVSAYAEETLLAYQDLELRVQSLERLLAELEPWGDFDPAHIRALEAQGVCVRRYRMDSQRWEDFAAPEGVLLEVVARKREVLFYTLSMGEPPEIPHATQLHLPETGLVEMAAELGRHRQQLASLEGELARVAGRMGDIRRHWITALNEAAFTGTVATLHREPYLFGLQGWIPREKEAAFREGLAAGALALHVVTREPLEGEEPPVLMRNNWFVRRIEPLLKLYGIPRYRHLDPSLFFAPFMVLFFGICLSDAGYGMLFYLISHVAGRRWSRRVEGMDLVVRLCKAFAVAAVAMGAVTGSVFGYSFESRSWILVDVDVNYGDPMILFYASLGLGVVHLSLSYLMGILQAAYLYIRMQKLGLILVLWGTTLLIARSIWFDAPTAQANAPMLYGGIGALACGLLLTLLFPNDSRRWAVRLGLGLWNIYGLTGLVGDLLSYARLFGLGIATSAVASVMNQLAGMALAAAGPVLGVVPALFILVTGHTFNLALSLLGSTVHSARLHFVEAFKSFFEGGGVAYKPFKIERGSL
jgi:V/A-type H+-transporting ATPase subunit I